MHEHDCRRSGALGGRVGEPLVHGDVRLPRVAEAQVEAGPPHAVEQVVEQEPQHAVRHDVVVHAGAARDRARAADAEVDDPSVMPARSAARSSSERAAAIHVASAFLSSSGAERAGDAARAACATSCRRRSRRTGTGRGAIRRSPGSYHEVAEESQPVFELAGRQEVAPHVLAALAPISSARSGSASRSAVRLAAVFDESTR